MPRAASLALPGFVLLVLAEMIVARARDCTRYEPRDTLRAIWLEREARSGRNVRGG